MTILWLSQLHINKCLGSFFPLAFYFKWCSEKHIVFKKHTIYGLSNDSWGFLFFHESLRHQDDIKIRAGEIASEQKNHKSGDPGLISKTRGKRIWVSWPTLVILCVAGEAKTSGSLELTGSRELTQPSWVSQFQMKARSSVWDGQAPKEGPGRLTSALWLPYIWCALSWIWVHARLYKIMWSFTPCTSSERSLLCT